MKKTKKKNEIKKKGRNLEYFIKSKVKNWAYYSFLKEISVL